MEARVKIPHFTHQLKSLLANFGRKSFAANIFGSESISDHNFALVLFDDQISLNQWQKVIQHGSRSLPVINWSRKFLFTRPSVSRVLRASESVLKPHNYFFITARYLKHAMPLNAISIFALFYIAYIEASFSVNKPCKIRGLPCLMYCVKCNYFPHNAPLFNNSIVAKEKSVHGERLNEKAQKWDAKV